MKKGVPKGYKHDWKYKVHSYKENKKGDFTEVQSKSRNRKTKNWGRLRKGSKLIWGLKGSFRTKRLKSGKYMTITKMRKWKKKVKPRGQRRWA